MSNDASAMGRGPRRSWFLEDGQESGETMIENDDRNQEPGKSSGEADMRADRKPGLRVSIRVEPEPAGESQDPPIPFVWTPIPHEAFDYDPVWGPAPAPRSSLGRTGLDDRLGIAGFHLSRWRLPAGPLLVRRHPAAGKVVGPGSCRSRRGCGPVGRPFSMNIE